MDAVAVTRAVVAGFPVETRRALARVSFILRPEPNQVDLDRGATPGHRGYFYGVAPEPSVGTEIPDDTPAEGEIVVFVKNHTDELELERTILHEVAHVLGKTEDEICGEGLGA